MKLTFDIVERLQHYNVAGLSLALIQNNEVSKAEGFGFLEAATTTEVSTHAIFNACSISKFVTSLLVMRLTESSILELDEDVNVRLTSWKVPTGLFYPSKPVTLRTLLSHQSGVVDPEGSFSVFDDTKGDPTMAELLAGSTPYCKDPITVAYEPMSTFNYSDAGFCIIQQVIEDVTGKPFELLMYELIFEPLELTNSTYQPSFSIKNGGEFACGHSNDGSVVEDRYPHYPYAAACGLWTTPTDIALLVIEVMNALHGRSKLGISEATVKEWMSPQYDKEWTGLGIFLDGSDQTFEISSLGWGVGFQCMLVAYPHLGRGAVIMTNTDSGVHQLEGIIGEVYQSVKDERVTIC
ncbi:beta-lactamase family protein [Paenibacillus sp. GSMTC-2017]|uniref:serine hydrolase domain-containing protein n=1 Tax=Paenibacillus sp. GSMTC-2017 TaxID=2794350 RepID=UPI0018D632FC|nr:serine hydrolase domain-containing protein [Paenibacillus sp. GSMTC-2017]MBH5319732.1 beta-lactamase family protein [Paenibacillus sp. GSMTC-2017]